MNEDTGLFTGFRLIFVGQMCLKYNLSSSEGKLRDEIHRSSCVSGWWGGFITVTST